MRPNKGEHRILEHREVYHKAKQGDGVAHALKSLKLPKGLGTAFLKGGGRGGQELQGTWSACAQSSKWQMMRQQLASQGLRGPSSSESEKAMAPHSSTLAWKIPWMEEPGGLQPMGSLSQT